MIVSAKAKPSNSRWLQASVLTLVALMIPCGITYARDYDAVAKRLESAVKAGELTKKQAEAMLHTLKAMKGEAKKGVDYDAVAEKLHAAVKAGKLTKEEARAKLAAIKKAAVARKPHAKKVAPETKKDVDYGAMAEKLHAAVKAGKLTKEEARAKLAAIKKAAVAEKTHAKKAAARSKVDVDYGAMAEKLHAAVKAGKLTKEEARAALAAIKRAAGGNEK